MSLEVKEGFLSEVCAIKILENLEESYVFVEGCNRDYEGEIKSKGANRVKIKQIGDIPSHSMSRNDVYKKLGQPDQLEIANLYIDVDQIAYFNVAVSNIDEMQSDEKQYNKFAKKAADAIARQQDSFVARFVTECPSSQIVASTQCNPNTIYDVLSNSKNILLKNNVPKDASLELIVPVDVQEVIIKALVETDKNNSEVLRNGNFGNYVGLKCKVSNNCFDDGTYVHGMLRTADSCGFVSQISKIIPYSINDELDTDAIKGYAVYGGRVIQPKQIVDLKFTIAGISLATA